MAVALESLVEKLLRGAQTAAEALFVRQTALHPMLWLSGIIMPPAIVAAYFFDDPLKTVLVIVGATPVVVTCLGFAFFAMTNPEKLQSEEYQIKHQAMEVLQVKTESINVSPASLNEIVGTVARQLERVREVESE